VGNVGWCGPVELFLSCPVLIILMSSRWKLTSNPWYVQEWGRIGWNGGPSVYRFAPARRSFVVCDPPDIGSRSGDSYGLPGRRDRHLRPNRGSVSPAGPAHNGAARLAGDLSAREASSRVASDPHANSKVESNLIRMSLSDQLPEFDSAGKYLLRRAPRRPVIATRSSGLP
jgi:hypothetical protein